MERKIIKTTSGIQNQNRRGRGVHPFRKSPASETAFSIFNRKTFNKNGYVYDNSTSPAYDEKHNEHIEYLHPQEVAVKASGEVSLR